MQPMLQYFVLECEISDNSLEIRYMPLGSMVTTNEALDRDMYAVHHNIPTYFVWFICFKC